MANSKWYASKLHLAVILRNVGWVKRLLTEGYNPNIDTGEHSLSLLHTALVNGDAEIAVLLKDAGSTAEDTCVISTCTKHWIHTLRGNKVEVREVLRPDPISF